MLVYNNLIFLSLQAQTQMHTNTKQHKHKHTTIQQPQQLSNIHNNKHQQNTAQTLHILPIHTQIDTHIYNINNISQYQLLTYTLKHCNLQQLENRLDTINANAAEVMRMKIGSESDVRDNIENYGQNLWKQDGYCQYGRYDGMYKEYKGHVQDMQDRIDNSLKKLAQCRKIAKLKLCQYLLLKSKQTNKKNIIKSNIFKYKEALTAIKQLRDRINNNLINQKELNQYRNRLKTSGLVMVPSLIENGLISYVSKSMYESKVGIQIRQADNLRAIVDTFMGKQDLLKMAIADKDRQGKSMISSRSMGMEQVLYAKMRQYLMLKRYINTRQIANTSQQQNNRYLLDTLCQQNITTYLQQHPQQISMTQFNKVRSVAQCDQLINSYLIHASKRCILDMLEQVIKFVNKITMKNKTIDTQFVEKIIAKNKKVNHVKNVQVPVQCNVYTNQQLAESQSKIILNQQVCEILQIIEDRQFLIHSLKNDLQLSISAKQLKYLVIIQSIKCVVGPMIKLSLSMKKNIYKDEKQRNYHYTRTMYTNIWAFKAVLGEDTVLKAMKIMRDVDQDAEKLRCRDEHDGRQCCRKADKEEKEVNAQKQANKKPNRINKKKKHSLRTPSQNRLLTLAQLFIQYNENYGQTYLYLINKLVNLQLCKTSNQYEMSSSKVQQQRSKAAAENTQRLTQLWIELVAQQITQHQLNEVLPANILKDVDFMQGYIIDCIDAKHRLENSFAEVERLLAQAKSQYKANHSKLKLKSNKQISQQQKQQIYRLVTLYNLRTRNYHKLSQISKFIGADNEIKSIHYQMYTEIYKKILL